MGKPMTEEDVVNLYTDPKVPGSLSSVNTFYKSLKDYFKEDLSPLKGWNVSKIEQALSQTNAFSLFKQPFRPKRILKYSQVLTSGVNSQWQADLIEFPYSYSKSNRGFNFLLVGIDVFSKRAFTQAVKRKDGDNVAKAFKTIFEETGVIPKKIQTDDGNEFKNQRVRDLFKKHHIKLFSTNNDEKAQIVERLNRTLKERFERLNQKTQSTNWIKYYKDVTSSYNRTKNTAHGFTPNNVGPKNTHLVRDQLYHGAGRYPMRLPPEGLKPKKSTIFPKGTLVRLYKKKRYFEKGSTRNWTTEVFRIRNLIKGTAPRKYQLEDLNEEFIEGSFYQTELQRTELPLQWAVEKVRTDKKTKQVLVSFLSIIDKVKWVSPAQLTQFKSTGKRWWYVPKGVGRWKGKFKEDDF